MVCGAGHPGVLDSIPKREETGKTGRNPVLKYRVPHGSQRSLVRDGQTSSHMTRLVVSRSTCPPFPPPPPREQLCNRYCSNKHTHLEVSDNGDPINGTAYCLCVCLLLQYLLQSCSRGGGFCKSRFSQGQAHSFTKQNKVRCYVFGIHSSSNQTWQLLTGDRGAALTLVRLE